MTTMNLPMSDHEEENIWLEFCFSTAMAGVDPDSCAQRGDAFIKLWRERYNRERNFAERVKQKSVIDNPERT